MIKYLNGDFDEEILKDKILVDFYADWCGPCHMMSEVLEKIDSIDVLKVNVDKYPLIARRYGVMSIPSLILFHNGNVEKTNVGFIDIDKLNKFIK